MDPFGVVEEEPVHEFLVEARKVEEERIVIVDEFFLDGAVEAFDVGVHLRCSGVRVVVSDLELEQSFSEHFLPLGTVVREHKGRRVREHPPPHAEELLGCF